MRRKHGTAVALGTQREEDAHDGQQPRRLYGKVEGNQEGAEDHADAASSGRGPGYDGMHGRNADGTGDWDADGWTGHGTERRAAHQSGRPTFEAVTRDRVPTSPGQERTLN